jgi:prepilin-type N-terminal cleavage/methylation domain-containing protein
MKIPAPYFRPPRSGFTLIEIALCLAVIGIALVAIIGVLPLGMDVQRQNREATIINQDATIFMEAIRNGARGADDLTNYVYAIVITNIISPGTPYGAGYLNPTLSSQMNFSPSVAQNIFPTVNNNWPSTLTSGADIIGLLGTPEFTNGNGNPNHIYVYVRSISGAAVEKPPQNNDLIVGDSFGYRVVCENIPVESTDTSNYGKELGYNLRELRLTFLWPVLPNGGVGNGRQTFRSLVAGQVIQTNDTSVTPSLSLYFFQSQSFTNVP